MPDETIETVAAQATVTDARFSIRTLLGVMTIVAVVATAAGMYLKSLDEETQKWLLGVWFVWLAIAIVAGAVLFARRRNAELRAGATLLSVPIHSIGRSTVFFVLVTLPFTLFVGGFLSRVFAELFLGSFPDFTRVIIFVPIAMITVSTLNERLWNRELRLCENGILYRSKLLPWGQLARHRWVNSSDQALQIFGIHSTNRNLWCDIPNVSSQRAEIDSIFQERAYSGQFQLGNYPIGLNEVPFHQALRSPVLMGRLLLAGIGFFLLLYFFDWSVLPRPWGRGAQGTLFSILILSSLASVFFRMRSTEKADAYLGRITARRDFIGILGWSLAGMVLWLLHQHFRGTSSVAEIITGIATFLVLLQIFAYFLMPDRLHLHANGVTMPGLFYWPWASIRVEKWDREGSGRLVLRRGIRRVVGFIPTAERDAMDRLLAEKVLSCAEGGGAEAG